jgi:hypothetical protein
MSYELSFFQKKHFETENWKNGPSEIFFLKGSYKVFFKNRELYADVRNVEVLE